MVNNGYVMQGSNSEASVGQQPSTVGATPLHIQGREGDVQLDCLCSRHQGPTHCAESALAALPSLQDHNVPKGAG